MEQFNPLNESVYNSIVDAIAENEFAPGMVITEVGLAQWLGVSRTPVREAIQRLKTEGLVKSFPGKGLIVTEVHLEDLLEVLEFRLLVEPAMCQKAALNMSSKHHEELLITVGNMLDAAKGEVREEWLKLDKKYHLLVLSAANNKIIMKALSERHPQVRRIMQNANILPGRFMKCTLEHEEIAKNIVAGNEAGAFETMRQHLISTREHMMRVSYIKNY